MMIGLVFSDKNLLSWHFVELRNVFVRPTRNTVSYYICYHMDGNANQCNLKRQQKKTDKNKAATEGLSATLKYAKQIRETYNDSLAENKGFDG
jgi:hypothetical protein